MAMWNSLKKLTSVFVIMMLLAPSVLSANSDAEMVLRSGIRYDFDGVDERTYKDTPTTFTTDTSGSWCAWFIFDTLSGADSTFYNMTGYGDTRTGTTFGQMQLGARRQDATYGSGYHFTIYWRNGASGTAVELGSSSSLSTGTQYFGCIVSSGTLHTMYVNAVSQTITTVSGTNAGDWFGDLSALTGTKRFAIGNVFRNNVWAPASIDGRLDDEIISSDQFTQAQITALFASGKPTHACRIVTCANVRGYWKLGEDDNGSITTAFDTKGNNNLTSENMETADLFKNSYY